MKKCDKMNGVSVIDIKQINTPGEGNLQFFESGTDFKEFPFDIKRIYYITDVEKDVCRGGHAHKELKQLLFCPYGNITLMLNNTEESEEIQLDRPNMGVIISQPVWREMKWNVKNSVLCVAASDYYYEEDYIRNYDDYMEYMKKNRGCVNISASI